MDILAARKKAAERARAGVSASGAPQSPVSEERRETEVQAPASPEIPTISFSTSAKDDEPAAVTTAPAAPDQAEVPAEPDVPSADAAGEQEEPPATAPESLDATLSAGPVESVEEGGRDGDQDEEQEQEQELLAFLLGTEEYAVPVDLVQEVLTPREITPVPHSRKFVLGVCSLRGIVLPIIDLHRRLGLPEAAWDEKSRILVMNLGPDDRVGLFVDRVRGVVRLLPSAVRPVPETIEQGAEFLQGVARQDDRMFILLDAGKTTEI